MGNGRLLKMLKTAWFPYQRILLKAKEDDSRSHGFVVICIVYCSVQFIVVLHDIT